MTAKILVVDRESDLEALKSADAEFWLSMSWAILTQGIDLTAAPLKAPSSFEGDKQGARGGSQSDVSLG